MLYTRVALLGFFMFMLTMKVDGHLGLGKLMRLAAETDDIPSDFARVYDHYLKTGERLPLLKKFMSVINFNKRILADLALPKMKGTRSLESAVLCLGCRAGVGYLLDKRREENATDEYVKTIAQDLCIDFNIMPEDVCHGLIDLNVDTLLYIVDNQPDLDSHTMCGLLLADPDCQTNNPAHDWQITVDDKKPKAPKPPVIKDPAMTIVQISDLHYDPKYTEGASAICDEPMCCRAKNGKARRPEEAAGKWGDYRDCDVPWETIVDTYEQVKRQHEKIDLIYFTGDVVDHAIWETTVEDNKESIRKTMRKMKEMFPDVTVLPVIGNHETSPLNVYSPEYVPQRLNTQWLYDFLAEEWSYWLPESTKETIKHGGYYTVLVKPGFRVIALNNNVAYVYNWWLFHDPDFMKEQLQWLHDTLLQAEKDGEMVHILAHIPSGETTNFVTWDREYRRVVERFSDVIKAQFNGHTHFDEFVLFYQNKRPRAAINVAFNGGSVTAFSYGNPNYKVYDVEPQTYRILDHHSWTYNLTAANLAGGDKKPEWYKMYSFKQDFGVKSVDPVDLDKLVQKMAKDQKLAYKYFEFKYKQGDITLAQGCDKGCLQSHVCRIATTTPFDYSWCDKHIPSGNPFIAFFEHLL